MKAVAIALVLLGFIAGCAGQQSPSPSASSDRPDLRYTPVEWDLERLYVAAQPHANPAGLA